MAIGFLNAAVVDFNVRGGFGQDIALDVTLTECSFMTPTFTPPTIGAPILFSYSPFSFYGIVDTYKQDVDNLMYTVQLTNGNHIISGVELILNDYYGSVSSVPNLLNIFGYMEQTGGFGFSGVNSAGMSWADISSTATTLINNISGNSYGAPITYKGYKYKIDLSNLPAIPTYYRINSDNINLVDFIADICSAGGCDYFIRLNAPTVGEAAAGWSGTFEVVTVSRTDEATPGRVAAYIAATPCATAKNYGMEVRKDVHSKFVVGANLERIYFNYPQDSGDNFFDDDEISASEYGNDTVLPFMGTDANNNVIIGYTPSGEPSEYYFNIDVSDIDLPIYTGEYLTCLNELRAARKGRPSWEKYLCDRDMNYYIVDPDGGFTDEFIYKPSVAPLPDIQFQDSIFTDHYHLPKYGYLEYARLKGQADADALYAGDKVLTYPHNLVRNYYWQRATDLKIADGRIFQSARMLEDDIFAKSTTDDIMLSIYNTFKEELGILNSEFNSLNKDSLHRASRYIDNSLGNFNDNKVDQLYRRIKGYADTYYNRKFMVSIPFTLAAFEPESNNIRMSQDVINEGFLDESAWAGAYSSGLIPDISGINVLLTQDNKFNPFVKYEDCVILDSGGAVTYMKYDFSEVGEGDKIFNTPVLSGTDSVYDCWVKCRVDEKVYFQDTETLYGPRAVIEIPGSVKLNNTTDYPTYAQGLFDMHAASTGVGGAFYGDAAVTTAFLKKSFDKIGGDDALYHNGEPIVYADLYAVPIRSKLLCYGPWYAIGASGKVSYERNQELNPWNYGGFDAMNQAGLARVQDGITNQTFSEVGSVSVVGAPQFNFGDQIISAGPYITDITCSFGSQGTTTTYGFQAWSTHRSLAKLNGFSVERNKRIAGQMRELKSNFREGIKNGKFKNAGDFYNKVSNRFIDLNDYTRRERSSTSHKIFAGEINGNRTMVATQPIYNSSAQAYTNFNRKAFMSMDGLLRPFSTVSNSGWPSFESPEATGSGEINSILLNPFQPKNDIQVLAYGTGESPEENGLLRGTGEGPIGTGDFTPYRAMGIRMPAIGVGWGYSTSGTPVPSGTGEDGFRDDYLYNPEYWKAGPIDLRWHETKKVWVPPSVGGLTIRFRISASYFCGECYVDAQVISVPFNVSLNDLPGVTINEYGDPDFGGNTVRIYDRGGCFFNEPPEDLVNRIGYAIYMTPLEDGPCAGTYYSSWECISLCCNEESCG